MKNKLPPSPAHPKMKDPIHTLWITLVRLQAEVEGIDLRDVPECVLEHYADQNLSVRQALDALTA